MRNIYYNIVDYKEMYPIGFWFFFLGILLFLVILSFVFRFFIRTIKKPGNIAEENNFESDFHNDKQKNSFGLYQGLKRIFKNYKLLLSVIIVQSFIILGLIFSKNRPENLSISSSKYIFGIDISSYQGKIDWKEMRTSHHPIKFVFIRATMGSDGIDERFKENWNKAKRYNYIRGAYHYYRPNENSTSQFQNFSSNVNIKKGDFIPILDIEKQSKFGTKNLREGVLNWLKLAERKYGVKPMIYTGLKFYLDNLKGYVDDYPLWIAAYSGKHRLRKIDWTFHQFTEKVRVKGIKSTVDGNDFKGDMIDMIKMCK